MYWIEIMMNYRSPTFYREKIYILSLPFKYCQSLRDNMLRAMDCCFFTILFDMFNYFLAQVNHSDNDLLQKKTIKLEWIEVPWMYLLPTQYLGSKLSIEIIHIMGQIGIAEGPFLIIPGLKVGMVQVNFSLLQDALAR